MPPLENARHEAFALAIVKGYSPKEAYKSAGYKASDRSCDTLGSNLSKNLDVSIRIRELSAPIIEATERAAIMTGRQVLEELTKLARANMLDYIGAHGQPLDISQLTREHAAAIQECTIDTISGGEGPAMQRVRIKLADKTKALEKLGNFHRLFGEFGNPGDRDEFRSRSDADIFADLARQAQELGIDVGVTFHGRSGDISAGNGGTNAREVGEVRQVAGRGQAPQGQG